MSDKYPMLNELTSAELLQLLASYDEVSEQVYEDDIDFINEILLELAKYWKEERNAR